MLANWTRAVLVIIALPSTVKPGRLFHCMLLLMSSWSQLLFPHNLLGFVRLGSHVARKPFVLLFPVTILHFVVQL